MMPPGQPQQQQGGPPQGPPPNPALQQAQQQLQQIQQQLEQIQENKQVLALLRDEKTRGYRIEIETDSTIEPDEQAEKKSRIEFTEITGKFLGEALPILQVMPQAAPLFQQALLFLVRGFRAGREMEDTIETVMGQISQAAQQPKPNPEEMKLQLEQKKMESEQQFKAQEAQMRQQEGQQKLQFEQQKHDQTMRNDQQKMAMEMIMRKAEMGQKMAEAKVGMATKVATAAAKPAPGGESEGGEAPQQPSIDMDEIMKMLESINPPVPPATPSPQPRGFRVIRDESGRISGAVPM